MCSNLQHIVPLLDHRGITHRLLKGYRGVKEAKNVITGWNGADVFKQCNRHRTSRSLCIKFRFFMLNSLLSLWPKTTLKHNNNNIGSKEQYPYSDNFLFLAFLLLFYHKVQIKTSTAFSHFMALNWGGFESAVI